MSDRFKLPEQTQIEQQPGGFQELKLPKIRTRLDKRKDKELKRADWCPACGRYH